MIKLWPIGTWTYIKYREWSHYSNQNSSCDLSLF